MPKKVHLDGKGSRTSTGRSYQSRKKKHHPMNRYSMENEEASTSTSAKKLKSNEDTDFEVNASFGYRLINFVSVFSAISEVVKCKTCGGEVNFTETSLRGLGFKLKLNCVSCEPVLINSCPLINGRAYDVNRRIVFAFRLLGIGLAGIDKFCGIMDLPKPVFQSFYDRIVNVIHIAAKKICELSMKNAVEKAKELDNAETLTVSGDGTWRKRGYSSLLGVSTLIAFYTGKVIDLIVKCSYCKTCEFWKNFEGTEEYEAWHEQHSEQCLANHSGSSGKMEVDAIVEMFKRSETLYGVRYGNYVGDGDSKTYKGIVSSKPYENFIVTKKECIGHVQKRMGTQLRKVKKDNKGLGGRGKLTAKLIDELTVYYGLAIRRSIKTSIEEMKNAIWATFFHKISTDEKPQHDRCPSGEDTWCSYQKAKASGTLGSYKHKNPLPDEVQEAIRPVYEKLSNDELLERCLEGYTQNNNESLNAVIWSMAPKVLSSGAKIVEIASYIAASIFNDGYTNVLLMMQVLNLTIGPNALRIVQNLDTRRVSIANIRAQEETKQARKLKRAAQKESEDITASVEESMYGPGIAD